MPACYGIMMLKTPSHTGCAAGCLEHPVTGTCYESIDAIECRCQFCVVVVSENHMLS